MMNPFAIIYRLKKVCIENWEKHKGHPEKYRKENHYEHDEK